MDYLITLIVALIPAIASFLGVYVSNRKSAALLEYRMSELERKVSLHNRVVERTYHLEEETTLLDERIKVANHRIDDLEKRSVVGG